jgi:alpha-glucosidase
MKKIFLVAVTLCLCVCHSVSLLANTTYRLFSPNKKLEMRLEVEASGEPTFGFVANGRALLRGSALGFRLTDGREVPDKSSRLRVEKTTSVRSVWKPVWGKRALVPDRYNERVFTFESGSGSLQLVTRAYDDGIAFCYRVPDQKGVEGTVASERTTYGFTDNFTAWYYNGERHNLGPERLADADGKRQPVMTVQAGNYGYMALHEAFLQEGEPLVFSATKGSTTMRVQSKPNALHAGYSSAWRVILYGKQPGDLVDSHTIELLNPDPAPGSDFSWVKPGVDLWDWRIDGAQWGDFRYTMSYPSWVRMIDFAAQQGFANLVLDANWYGPEFAQTSDPTKGDKAKDVQRIIQYGKEKGVGVWLYINDVAGKSYPLEQTLAQYASWGASGVKYGFMNGSPEEKNKRTIDITALCAKYHLMVDYHDYPVHPFGQMRTWPNAVTREFCKAQLDGRDVFYPKTFVTSVFVNMVSGPIDMNNGMFDLRKGRTTRVDNNQEVPSTLASEAARTLIVFSGATILPDIPEFYQKYPALLRFLSAQKMPWKESKTLKGEIGQYIVMMRESARGEYLIGAATNEEKRSLDVPLSFLPKGEFVAEVVEDGDGAHYLNNRETIRVTSLSVTRKTRLKLMLAPGGGATVRITAAP